MIQAQIDRMNDAEQMVVKTSAVLGKLFSRDLLQHVMVKKMPQEQLNAAVLSIAENGVFACGSPPNKAAVTYISGQENLYECFCKQPTAGNQSQGIARCRLFSFKSGTVQETAYEMYTESLRRKIHIAAGKFLESQAHRCEFCGGQNIGERKTSQDNKRESVGFSNLTEFLEYRSNVVSDEDDIQEAEEKNISASLLVSRPRNSLKNIRKQSLHTSALESREANRELLASDIAESEEDDEACLIWERSNSVTGSLKNCK